MASLATLTLSDLIDETLEFMQRDAERPFPCVVGTTELSNTTDTTVTFANSDTWDRVTRNDILENGEELMLVTAKSSDATPVFTVARGYASTTPETALSGSSLLLNPQFSRTRVRRAILRCFKNSLAVKLPCLQTDSLTVTTSGGIGVSYLAIPAAADDVVRVAHFDTTCGRWLNLSGWTFEDDVPTSIVSTGKLITFSTSWLSRWAIPGSDTTPTFQVTYRLPYVWAWTSGMVEYTGTDPTDETATISIPIAGSNLPVLYATAYLLTGRELTRAQVDEIEEWNNQAPLQSGVSLKLAMQAWQLFYSTLEEVRGIQNLPKHRPYRPMRNF